MNKAFATSKRIERQFSTLTCDLYLICHGKTLTQLPCSQLANICRKPKRCAKREIEMRYKSVLLMASRYIKNVGRAFPKVGDLTKPSLSPVNVHGIECSPYILIFEAKILREPTQS